MNKIKKLGLAAVAAMSLMAFVGLASASATTVCSANQTGTAAACAGSGFKYGNDILTSDAFNGAQSGSGTLTSSNGTVTCTGSSVTGKFNSDGTASTGGGITAASWSGCTSGFFSCTVAPTSGTLPFAANIAHTSGSDGTLTITAMSVHISCAGGFVSCTATAPTGGVPLAVTASSQTAKATNDPLAGCGTGSSWNATYNVTSSNGGGNLHVEA